MVGYGLDSLVRMILVREWMFYLTLEMEVRMGIGEEEQGVVELMEMPKIEY